MTTSGNDDARERGQAADLRRRLWISNQRNASCGQLIRPNLTDESCLGLRIRPSGSTLIPVDRWDSCNVPPAGAHRLGHMPSGVYDLSCHTQANNPKTLGIAGDACLVDSRL